jgi:FtsP/CotA-like multicopper oxidase with cupredoxin domain
MRIMDRREFLKKGFASAGSLAALSPLVAACVYEGTGAEGPLLQARGGVYRPVVVSPRGLTLTARQTTAEIAPGISSPILSWGDGPVGPTIEARRGERASIVMQNELQEPVIAHWHGLRPPESADGHPRLAVGPGQSYAYDFEVNEPAGLYWYHSHAHMRTGAHVYHGLAGLFIVRDDVEASLGLPAGGREISLVLQDKRQSGSGELVYRPMGHQMMEGVLGDASFVNGVHSPRIEVDSALYRLRLLGAGNARIFRVALSSGAPLVMIGSDGGLLDRAVELPYVDLSTGERIDLLVDFSGIPSGSSVTLRSLGFQSPSAGMGMGMGMMAGGRPQGAEMDLVEFVVTREVRERSTLPTTLVPHQKLNREQADRERRFRFDSRMMRHTVNGREFDMERVDERVPFGSTEVWRFINDAPFPHPVHMHAVHFQVLSRSGGRGRVLPWETGWKDTVLLLPGEEVEVISTFDRHRGLFLLHCHNLEHEDMGMMMNFLID